MNRKRYTHRQAQRLLAQIVNAVSVVEVKREHRGASNSTQKTAVLAVTERKGKQLLVDVLTAPIGDMPLLVGEAAITSVRDASIADVMGWFWELWKWLDTCASFPTSTGHSTSDIGLRVTNVSVGRRSSHLVIDGPVNRLLIFKTMHLLGTVGPDRVRECDCGCLFVRIGKMQQCSDRCAKRVYMRRFRAGKVGKE